MDLRFYRTGTIAKAPIHPQDIADILALLERHPLMGQATTEPGIRRLVVSPYSYLIFYEVTADEIVVHAVRHASRDPSSMPGL